MWAFIVTYLTWEILNRKPVRRLAESAYSYWGRSYPVMSYFLIALLGAGLFCVYWRGISKAFAHFHPQLERQPVTSTTGPTPESTVDVISQPAGELVDEGRRPSPEVGRQLTDVKMDELANRLRRLKTSETFYSKVHQSADDGPRLANDIGKALREAGISYSIQTTMIMGLSDKGVVVGTIGDTPDSVRDKVAGALKDVGIPEVQTSLRGKHPEFTPMFRQARGIGIVIGHR
jgi:hypothetical protein